MYGMNFGSKLVSINVPSELYGQTYMKQQCKKKEQTNHERKE